MKRIEMKINEALNIIHDHAEFNPDDIEWHKAFDTLTAALGVVYDKNTEQFITTDTGHVI
jgi:hypothetical protein